MTSDNALASGLARAGHTAYEADYTKDAVVARYLTFFESLTEARPCAG